MVSERLSVFLRSHAVIAFLLVILAGFYLPFTWSDQLASLGGDSAVYVLTARDYAPYLPRDPVAEAIAANTVFPPLYSLLLAAGGGAVDVHFAHAITTLFLLLAFVAFYAWQRELGIAPALACAGVALFAVLPGTYQQALHLHSESLYLALSLGCLATLTRAARLQSSPLFWTAAGFFGAALLTRSAAIALLPCFALIVLMRRPKPWFWMLLLPLIPSLLWGTVHHPETGYGDGLLRQYQNLSAVEIFEKWVNQAWSIGLGFLNNVLQTTALLWLVHLSAGLALIVATARFCRIRPDAWYLFTYLAMVILWPYPAEATRFAWALLPLPLGYLLWLGQWAGQRLSRQQALVGSIVRGTFPLALALAVVPVFSLAVNRAWHPDAQENPALRYIPEWYGVDKTQAKSQVEFHLELAAAIRDLGTEVPAGACVFSVKPALVAYYGGRHSFVPPYETLDDALFWASINSAGCKYFLLLAISSPTFSTAYYPLDRLGDRAEIVEARTSARDASQPIIAALARLIPQ